MAAVMHKNLLDTLTSGSMTMTEVAQSPDDGSIIQFTPLHESASDPTTNTIEDLKSEEVSSTPTFLVALLPLSFTLAAVSGAYKSIFRDSAL